MFDQRFKHLYQITETEFCFFCYFLLDAISSLGTNHGFSPFSQEIQSKSKLSPVMSLDLKEHPMPSTDFTNQTLTAVSSSSIAPLQAKTSSSIGMRWWEKSTKHNMLEIHSANHLVDSLLNAGDKLVILDFYSPACGGCKSLHPTICRLADSNPNVMFLKVNQEELRTMCHGLNVHVLPFFKLYRGAEGKLCSFSCTIATINKFKKALDKHGSERCSLGPAKGLNAKDLAALVSVGELKMNLNSLENHQASIYSDMKQRINIKRWCYKKMIFNYGS